MKWRVITCTVVALAMACGSGSNAATAAAAYRAGFTHPQRISGPRSPSQLPGIAVAPDGSAVAVWERLAAKRNTALTYVAVARRTPSGSWSRARLISDGAVGEPPQVAVGSNGSAVVVWTRYQGRGGVRHEVWAAAMTGSGHWGTRYLLGRGDRPSVGFARREALVAWERFNPHGKTSLRASWHRRGWARPFTIARTSYVIDGTQVTLNGRGRGAVFVDGGDEPEVEAWQLRNGRFRPGHVVTRGIGIGGFVACSAADQPVVVVWADNRGIESATLGLDGQWGRTRMLAPGTFPQCAMNARGRAIAAWVAAAGAAIVATSDYGGAWSSPEAISDPDDAVGRVWVAINDRGVAAADWDAGSRSGDPDTNKAAVLAADGSWSPASVLARGSGLVGYANAAAAGAEPPTAIWDFNGAIYAAAAR